jgi:hypothetical protein
MKTFLPTGFRIWATFVTVHAAFAQGSGLLALPSDLPAAQAQFATAMKTVTDARDEKLTAARKAYAELLARAQAEATSKGDLDGAVAAKTERERALAGELTEEDRKKLPATLLPQRARYDQGASQIEMQARTQESAVLRNYIAMLDALQKRITMKGELDKAMQVKDERKNISERLASIESGKASRATAPLTPTTPGLAALASKMPAIEVAASLKARGSAKDPGPNTVVFDGPGGNGRSGAKGILLKVEPGAGSTWMFKYKRGGSAYAIQIIHPLGRGHAIAHLGSKTLGIATPKSWLEIGWGNEGGKEMRKTKTFDEIFPLKEDEEYQIVSRMSAGGNYELFVDGKLVATAHVSGADPLVLDNPEGKRFSGAGRGPLIFKGQDLPMKWAPGWAGVIMGPLDEGVHIASELKYLPRATDGQPAVP